MPVAPGGTKTATSNWPNLMFVPKGAKHPKEGFELSADSATQGQYEWWDRWADVPGVEKVPRGPRAQRPHQPRRAGQGRRVDEVHPQLPAGYRHPMELARG